jgi:outer membrane protein assembly factor BamA
VVYPLNRNYRLEGNLGVFNRDIFDSALVPLDDPNTPKFNDFAFLGTERLKSTNAVIGGSITGDTIRYNEWGPWHGKRFRFSVATSPFSAGDEATYTNYDWDFRAYGKTTRRSLFAFRMVSIITNGEGATLFGIGGFNQIRGYSFREFVGDRAAIMNIEYRFPLVDDLRFPFGSIRWIRGLLFLDVGAAWTQNGYFFDRELGSVALFELFGLGGVFRDFKFYDSDDNILRDGRASYGIGFNFRMGIFELNWTFARRFPYQQTDKSTCEPAINATFDPLTGSVDLVALSAAMSTCGFERVRDDRWRGDFYIGYSF